MIDILRELITKFVQEQSDAGQKNDALCMLRKKVSEFSVQHRVDTNSFLAHHISIWNSCFACSEEQYEIALEITESYRKAVESESNIGKYQTKQYTYNAVACIHARACQAYLEVLCLVENGFADGAFARWRTLYELSVIGAFIYSNGEDTAKAYLEHADTDDKSYAWAKNVPCLSGKRINFTEIEKVVSDEPQWKSCYNIACWITHGSPQGTLGRIGTLSPRPNFLSVGRSDYGIDVAAIAASKTLTLITKTFLGVFHYENYHVDSLLLAVLETEVFEHYKAVASETFDTEEGSFYTRISEIWGANNEH